MPLEPAGFVPLPSGKGAGFDHADVYTPKRRMYVAHTGAARVDRRDCPHQRHLPSLPDLPVVADLRARTRARGIVGARAGITEAFPEAIAGPWGGRLDGARHRCAAAGAPRGAPERRGRAASPAPPLPGVPDVVWHDAELRR